MHQYFDVACTILFAQYPPIVFESRIEFLRPHALPCVYSFFMCTLWYVFLFTQNEIPLVNLTVFIREYKFYLSHETKDDERCEQFFQTIAC